jgi:isocitrate dehydrogenase
LIRFHEISRYNVPLYVADPKTDVEKANKEAYAKVLGSAVNPVLREGNSDRRVAAPVKNYAKKNPHTLGAWSRASKSHVAHMTKGDFYANEQSYVANKATSVKIELVGADGSTKVMKQGLKLTEGEVIDASFLSVAELRTFLKSEMDECLKENMLFSLHMKATMMKISDPIIFGHAVSVFFEPVFTKYAAEFKAAGVNENNGFNDVLEKVKQMPAATKDAIMKDIDACYESRPWLAMVDSGKGITNLHTPSDVIVDASMPCVVRDSGKMWNKDNELEDVKCVIPDRCYATMYQEIMSYCKQHGQFDVSTMGNVCNVGLMAQKAEEYGSHDKTFCLPSAGTMRVTDEATGEQIFSHAVAQGDIWRMCQTKDAPIKDWVRLAVSRARATGDPAIFWLDHNRAHDRNLISKVNTYLALHDTKGLDISIATPVHAMRRSCERATAGLNTISVTGNVLRDYLTDLFPIIELGTSAKMLSIVPLLAGGGLFETGAGGSAPKHVEQFLKEGHLRWDSLGEYLAVAVSFEHMAETTGSKQAGKLGATLNKAIERLLENRKSPGRKVNQLDNRASNFYIALYWADFMAQQDPAFKGLADKLKESRSAIVGELKQCQGKPVDVGGYYKVDPVKAAAAMRPSATFNRILEEEK